MQILSYNQPLIRNYLNTYQFGNILLKDILAPEFNTDYFREYDNVFKDRMNFFVDRTGKIPHYLNIKIDPMPVKQLFTKSFEQVVNERVNEILSQGRPIKVLWSGGLDSTFVLFALMANAKDLKQISVFGTYGSVLESGGLFDKFIKDRVQYTIRVNGNDAPELEEDCVLVSGMLGNQIFGPEQADITKRGNKRFGGVGYMNTPWDQHVRQNEYELLAPAVEASPRSIKTLGDFRWFMSFNFLWQQSRYEHWTQFSPDVAKNIIGFFDTNEFQQWALNTEEPFQLDQKNDLTHRWQMRELISQWTEDTSYANYKTKAVSILTVKKPAWGYLTDNYNSIFLKDHYNA